MPEQHSMGLVERIKELLHSPRLVRLQAIFQDLGLLFLRFASGALMLTHGWPKYTGFAEKALKFPDPLGVGHATSLALAIFAEVICALLVMLGLGTSFASLVIVINFWVIVSVVHGADPIGEKEAAIFYLLIYLVLLMTGPGRFSLDALILKGLKAKEKTKS